MEAQASKSAVAMQKIAATGEKLIGKGVYTRNYAKVRGVRFNEEDERKKLMKKEKITLKAWVIPFSAFNKMVTWKSSNPKVVSVSKNGVVTAKKPGKATITVKTKRGKRQRHAKSP